MDYFVIMTIMVQLETGIVYYTREWHGSPSEKYQTEAALYNTVMDSALKGVQEFHSLPYSPDNGSVAVLFYRVSKSQLEV